MKSSHINHLWASLLIEELVRCGVCRFIISPGSRNSPLVLAAAENDRAETLVHYDERGAAFYALGWAKATGIPAALICTSGTALANYFPAIVEASQSCTPLLILSGDRPVELRDCRAPQAIKQAGIFGDSLRWSFDLPSPDESISPAFLLTTADQAVFRTSNSPRGPVLLNCQFREPLAPLETNRNFDDYLQPVERWLNKTMPFTRHHSRRDNVDARSVEGIVKMLAASRSGVIVAGGMKSGSEFDSIVRLANTLEWPLLADITSGLRSLGSTSQQICSYHDLYLRQEPFAKSVGPDLILHFGDQPTSKALQRYLERSSAEYIMVNDHPFRQDPGHVVSHRIQADPSALSKELLSLVSSNRSKLSEKFHTVDKIAAAVVEEITGKSESLTEPLVARLTTQLAPADSGLFLASSMPIRDGDGFGGSAERILHVCVNRGANGIDGSIATAAGFAAGLGKPTTALVGDIALLHDLNSLKLVKDSAIPITLIVVNNDGGGIFSFLPIAEVEAHFERFFGAPHGLTFRQAAEMYNLMYIGVSDPARLRQALESAALSPESSLLEVKTDRRSNVSEHRKIWRAVAEALAEIEK